MREHGHDLPPLKVSAPRDLGVKHEAGDVPHAAHLASADTPRDDQAIFEHEQLAVLPDPKGRGRAVLVAADLLRELAGGDRLQTELVKEARGRSAHRR